MTRSAGTMLTAGAAAAITLLVVALWPEPPHVPPRRDPNVLYRKVLDSDFSGLGSRHGFSFRGVHGMLTPEEAAERRSWLVYVGFDGPPGRHRISYQIATPQQAVDHDEAIRVLGRCQHDVAGWECFGSLGNVYVQGESVCLEPDCATTKRQAETLLRLGIEHLQSVLAS